MIKSTLESGEDVLIPGFEKFYMKAKGEQRLGRKPKSGDELVLSARRVVGFKSSALLKEKGATTSLAMGMVVDHIGLDLKGRVTSGLRMALS
ncbi:MAG: HU family DNA-binding protein [Desulfatiglandales bacterium]|nr:HU family DNA-binding protein [Desulfatiglandales bacterium]